MEETKKDQSPILKIFLAQNGYIIEDGNGGLTVVEEKEYDPCATGESLLLKLIELLGLQGNRHDQERIAIIRVMGDKHELGPGERAVKKQYLAVSKVSEKPPSKKRVGEDR